MLFFCVVVNAFIFFLDVGPVHPVGLSTHVHAIRDDESITPELDVSLHGVERNLTRLIAHMPMTDVEDISLRMQWLVT